MVMAFTTPASALLVDLEADELQRRLPSLLDLLYENPLIASVLETACSDVLSGALVRLDDGQVALDGTVLGLRVAAWRKSAQDVLAITGDAG